MPAASTSGFEADRELDFAFFLADRLGLTLSQLDAMPAVEYLRWQIWHGRRMQAEQRAGFLARMGII